MKESTPQAPLPVAGMYTFELLSLGTTETQWWRATLRIAGLDAEAAEHHAIGDEVELIWPTKGDAYYVSQGKIKQMVRCFAGFANEAEYNATYRGAFIDACFGERNEYLREDGSSPIEGCFAYCRVTRGKPTPDGNDYYRECQWWPVEAEGES